VTVKTFVMLQKLFISDLSLSFSYSVDLLRNCTFRQSKW